VLPKTIKNQSNESILISLFGGYTSGQKEGSLIKTLSFNDKTPFAGWYQN
jgi:hypothetical protein